MGVKRPEGERYRKPGRPNVHCWVWLNSTTAMPGLVLEWRKTKDLRWQARVIYTDMRLTEGSRLTEQWVPGHVVTQASTNEPEVDGQPF